jgi:hypothetical protein
MNDENKIPPTSAIVEADEEKALVETDITPETQSTASTSDSAAGPTTPMSPEMQAETAALVDAIKKRAQAEVHSAETFSREAYLEAVRQARLAIEENKLIDPDRIEESIQHLQQDAEDNWNSIVKEIESLGDRISDAAKAAWEVLTEPRDTTK